jgi:hypothetical protein
MFTTSANFSDVPLAPDPAYEDRLAGLSTERNASRCHELMLRRLNYSRLRCRVSRSFEKTILLLIRPRFHCCVLSEEAFGIGFRLLPTGHVELFVLGHNGLREETLISTARMPMNARNVMQLSLPLPAGCRDQMCGAAIG